eukprot:Seg3459.2 transcript_id=Seg3459.2/GoldUCD/mRNA.D3Y31 product="hypothetical protein" protein_id=Seg3459.2/GoldUCD/D3Y31
MIRASDKSLSSWCLDELLIALEKELEIRESNVSLLKNASGNQEKQTRPRQREECQGGTATTLHIGIDGGKQKCVYCLQEHEAEMCDKVKETGERTSILRKYAKCFICLNSGHISWNSVGIKID